MLSNNKDIFVVIDTECVDRGLHLYQQATDLKGPPYLLLFILWVAKKVSCWTGQGRTL